MLYFFLPFYGGRKKLFISVQNICGELWKKCRFDWQYQQGHGGRGGGHRGGCGQYQENGTGYV